MTSIITYDQMKKFYQEFKNNPPADKFCRCLQELNFMRSLIDFAERQNLEKDVFEYKKIQEAAAQQLREMGYKVTIKN